MTPIRSLALLVLAAAAPVAAHASSPDAWAAFRQDVQDRCVAAGREKGMTAPSTIVHPFGTSSYGVAVLVEGKDKRICIYDKRAKTVELTDAP